MQQLSLLKGLASAKRGSKERQGIHAWHPYYAGYSEAFVESAIAYLELDSEDAILDPWNGSGTTTLVASQQNLAAIGCDINPVASIFAAAKNGTILKNRDPIGSFLERFRIQMEGALVEVDAADPLLEFAHPSLCALARTAYQAIAESEFPELPVSPLLLSPLEISGGLTTRAFPLSRAASNRDRFLNPYPCLLAAALFVVTRQLGGYKGGSNPTWVKALDEKPTIDQGTFVVTYDLVLKSMLKDLEAAGLSARLPLLSAIALDDSKNLGICSESIDAVIASPPYLTRIDYAVSTKPELLIVQPHQWREIRENSIGTPAIVDKTIAVDPSWGTTCTNLLARVAEHPSKAAKSYYLPNILQYFRDVEMSLIEAIRVLKPGGQALIVVQSSYFKEQAIDLGQIYLEILHNLGIQANLANREVVRGHLAHVNTKSNQYKPGKIYFEDVIHLIK